MFFRLFIAGLLASVVLSPVPSVLAQAEERPRIVGDAGNPITESEDPFRLDSVEGDFEVLFPSGCSKLRELMKTGNSQDDPEGRLRLTVASSCDRKGARGEGCSVLAFVDQDPEAGAPADPAFVLARVQEILGEYGVEILEQKPCRLQVPGGPLMEGVDVLASDAERHGQVWVRGLLVEGDVYVLVAWRTMGQLAIDPDYVAFFESFRAHGS